MGLSGRHLDRIRASVSVVDKHSGAMARVADRHYIMDKGSLVWQGDSEAYCVHMSDWSNILEFEFNEIHDLTYNVRRAMTERLVTCLGR